MENITDVGASLIIVSPDYIQKFVLADQLFQDATAAARLQQRFRELGYGRVDHVGASEDTLGVFTSGFRTVLQAGGSIDAAAAFFLVKESIAATIPVLI